ncbi:MAG: carboxypeptidase regulatory-like domain-containing protein, partial [Candidatus Muiribacteriota bacterium]
SNEPVKNAYVVFGNQITRSDNEGLFSIQLNSFNPQDVIISANNYQIYQDNTTPEENVKIELERKIPYNEIQGQVIKREDFGPVSGIKVHIGNQTVKTDRSGQYFLKNLKSGEYPIRVKHEEYKDYNDVVQVYRGNQNFDIILEERDKYGYVFGYIKKRSNLEPVKNALVAIDGVSLRTNRDGFYELHGVKAQRSQIVVLIDGEEAYRKDILVTEGDQQNDIVLD